MVKQNNTNKPIIIICDVLGYLDLSDRDIEYQFCHPPNGEPETRSEAEESKVERERERERGMVGSCCF